MTDIFVSYSSADRERVRPLVELLRREHWDVWWDRRIEAGVVYDVEIERAIDSAKCILVVWSRSSVSSDWVRTEATEALERGIIVPVILENIRVPLAFRRTQSRSLVGYPGNFDRKELHALISDVRSTIAGTRDAGSQSTVGEIRGERRSVTSLRADIVGLTALGDRLTPEESSEVERLIERRARDILAAHEGTIRAFDQGGLTAVFGFPVAYEDDAVRALHAAAALVSELGAIRFNTKVLRETGIAVRVGVASGPAITTADESGNDYWLSGNVMRLAGALCAAAEDGETLISTETLDLVGPYFQTRAHAPVRLEETGKAIEAHAVLGRSRVESRIDAGKTIGFTAFCGRRREMVELREALGSLSAGSGRVVSLIAEAGVGKSRLIYEFRQAIAGRVISVYEGRCQAHGQMTAYLPFIEILRSALDLESLPHDMREERVVQRLLEFDQEISPYIPALLHLLSIPSSRHAFSDTLEGPARRQALQDALLALLSVSAARKPTVVILDDWHWADDASNELLQQLIELATSQQILLIVSARPTAFLSWPQLVHTKQLMLQPLDRQRTSDMIRSVLGASQVPAALLDYLHRLTEGNPFFTEELCHALVDLDLVKFDGDRVELQRPFDRQQIPTTIEAVVRARIDQLGPELRTLLRMASVIGRTFSRGILEELAENRSVVGAMLAQLSRSGLIRQSGLIPEPEFRFSHVLTQTVAYDSILPDRRRAFHGAIGRIIENRYRNQLREWLELLAYHYVAGGDAKKSIEYSMRAGAKNAQAGANTVAIQHFDTAVQILEREDDSEHNTEALLNAYVAYGNALILIKGYADERVIETYGRARALLNEMQSVESRFGSVLALWRYYYNRSLLNEADDHAAQLIRIADAGSEESMRVAAYTAKGINTFWRGDIVGARTSLEDAISGKTQAPNRADELKYGMSPTVMGLTYYGLAIGQLGEFRRAIDVFDEALGFSRAIDHPASEVFALYYLSLFYRSVRSADAAVAVNDELLGLTEKHQFAHWHALGMLARYTDRLIASGAEQALIDYRKAAEAVLAFGVGLTRISFHILMAASFVRAGNAADATRELGAAAATMRASGALQFEPELDIIRGQLAGITDPPSASQYFERALRMSRDRKALVAEFRASLAYSQFLLHRGCESEVLNLMGPLVADHSRQSRIGVVREAFALIDRIG